MIKQKNFKLVFIIIFIYNSLDLRKTSRRKNSYLFENKLNLCNSSGILIMCLFGSIYIILKIESRIHSSENHY